MQQDEVIWQIINHQFCSFKTKVAKERTFCQNPYNVTGLCLRSACPLANSRYATIREEEGVCYLYMKTIERAHTPSKLWEKIKLPANYTKALDIVSEQLEYFPKYLVHRNKQRLTKIHQMLIRMRKLKLKLRPKIVTTNTKVDRREIGNEAKALKAAQLDRAIENELLERLKQVSDGEIYNYPEQQYTKALSRAEKKHKENEGDEGEEEEEEEEEGEEEEEEEGEEEEEEEEEDYNVEYVEDFDESDEEYDAEEVEEVEDSAEKILAMYAKLKETKNKRKQPNNVASSSGSTTNTKTGSVSTRSKKQRGSRVEIEYEDEGETENERTKETLQQSYDF